METQEIWKPIPGYKNYEASNLGNIRRVTPLSMDLFSTRGYRIVRPCEDGKAKTKTVHKLVMLAFNGNKEGMVIDHINGDQKDNRIENLRYVTQSENLTADNVNRSGRRNVNRRYGLPKGKYIYKHNASGKYQVLERVGDKVIHRKYVNTIEEGLEYFNNCE